MRRSNRSFYPPATPPGRQRIHRAVGLLASAALVSTMVACTSGDGGDNGHGDNGNAPGVVNPGKAGGLTFTYPIDGQKDVYTQTQIAISFAGDIDKGAQGLTLVANPGRKNQQVVDTTVTQDRSQSGILRLAVADNTDSVERPALTPDTTYAVQATDEIGSGNTVFHKGDTLFSFTTRPAAQSPSKDGFEVVEYRGDNKDKYPFTQFNTVRITLSEAVDPSSVVNGDTFRMTDSGGAPVPGRLVVQGRHISFDPSQDLAAGESYTVQLGSGDNNAVRSIFGTALANNSRSTFKLTPVSVGKVAEQNVVIEPTSMDVSSLPANELNGGPANVAAIVSQLVGRNVLPALNNQQRRSLLTRLASPSDDPRYKGTFPAVIPAGQQFDLGPLNLKLGGAITTPIQSGNVQARFLDDADVFITANNLRNIQAPTAVRLRFDLGIGADIQNNDQNQIVANGALNQTAMNVVAAGLAIPQDNGDIRLVTLGSFPAAVNRNGQAITDFELELTLRAGSQSDIQNQPDSTQPYVTAQYPSACLYTFGANLDFAQELTGVNPVPLESAEDDCAAASAPLVNVRAGAGDGPAGITDFLPSKQIAITFSEPIDPETLANIDGTYDGSHLALNGPDGAVAFTAHAAGNSVVIHPDEPLAADTFYTISIGSGLRDYGGNSVANAGQRTFRTAPYVEALPPQKYEFTDAQGQTSLASVINVAQTAPFLTALVPGIPCALDPASGDFQQGGSTAGYCAGDQQDSTDPSIAFPVFTLPANQAVQAQFTKPVKTASIQLAKGCLTGNGGNIGSASVAVQKMSSDGSCQGVVPGKLIFDDTADTLTRTFEFVPERPWQTGQRYWLVICGNEHDQCAPGAGTITGRDDGNGVKYVNTAGAVVNAPYSGALNTTPILGTGTAPASGVGLPDDVSPQFRLALGQGFRPAAGGPDIVMPFDGAPASRNYAFLANSLPLADANGNGILDAQDFNPTNPTGNIQFPGPDQQPQQERHVAANATYLQPIFPGLPGQFSYIQSTYQSGAVPNVVEPLTTDCAGARDILGSTPAQCLPVQLSEGGMFELTALAGTGRRTPQAGRILLRVAANKNNAGQVTRQKGYIVSRCSGTIGEGDDAKDYNYSPCFVLSLHLIANGPDGLNNPLLKVNFQQQRLSLELVGPVSFERNGQLVLTLRNTNAFVLDKVSSSLFGNIQPGMIPLNPGDAHIQLVGNAIHGGPIAVK